MTVAEAYNQINLYFMSIFQLAIIKFKLFVKHLQALC